MRLFFQFHTILAILALSGMLGMRAAHAGDGSLYDWQPCSDSLAIEDGAAPSKKWDLTLSPYTHHWSHNPEHRPVALVGIDNHVKGGRFCGMALFSNSFGQESAYVYVGQQWDGLLGNPKLFTKVSAGFLYGYRGQYKDKIPFNNLGIAPAIIPSIGYTFTPQDSGQIYVLGTAGLLFAYTRSF